MPQDGYRLVDFPLEMVELACDKCGRHGRMRKSTLLERYGADIALPDLRLLIADCELAYNMHDRCGVYYTALKPH